MKSFSSFVQILFDLAKVVCGVSYIPISIEMVFTLKFILWDVRENIEGNSSEDILLILIIQIRNFIRDKNRFRDGDRLDESSQKRKYNMFQTA